MPKIMPHLLLVISIVLTPLAAQAGTCDALFGKFLVPKEPSGKGVIEIAQSLLDPKYQLGQPALEIYQEGSTAWRRGLMSGSRSEVEIGTDSDVFGAKCAAKLGTDVSIVTFDYALLAPEVADGLMEWLERIWGKRPSAQQLQDVHYFLVQDVSMIGVADMVLMVPLDRYENP